MPNIFNFGDLLLAFLLGAILFKWAILFMMKGYEMVKIKPEDKVRLVSYEPTKYSTCTLNIKGDEYYYMLKRTTKSELDLQEERIMKGFSGCRGVTYEPKAWPLHKGRTGGGAGSGD